jgi:hypothetical protein
VRPEPTVKSFEISKRLIYGAWEKVRANGGAPGVDAVSIERFAAAEADNLYQLWNRMSSGSYFPGPVRAVEIPKDHGEQSSRLVDEDLLGGFGLRRFVGSFDELAVDEHRAGTHECNQMGCVDCSPAVLCGLDELERHR